MAIIKTPDQRVRVFISSTINELADERKAAREAISNLRLIPVFFEAGARPHPPRDLYSAYLDQSHIFVGIYWNSYGWVAPGAEISGLEDEYRLCGAKPKLIYVKNSSDRQPRLNDLLQDIQNSDTACYQKFNTAEELQTLLENDLSVLMSESFENSLLNTAGTPSTDLNNNEKIHSDKLIELPLIKSQIIGRDEDLANLKQLISKPEVSFINILGAGGTGKTTIAIHLAHQIVDNFTDGVIFISLAPVTDSALVASTIAGVLGLQDSGKEPIQQLLTEFLTDKNMLLVLDNFEQIVEAANIVSGIITNCKNVKIIVTSRATLHIRGEYIYNLSPLSIPGQESNATNEELKHFPSIALFIARAQEVNQNLLLDESNTDAIVEICQRLDGLPLAIELAASRTKLFQPTALLTRMGKSLDLVSKGQRDLPQRQQTLRNTIEWSYNLLDEESKKVFRMLGVFKRSWTLEAIDSIVNADGKTNIDIEEITEKLLDVSLIKPALVSHSSEPRFNMLQTVHEFAAEKLTENGELKNVQLQYANYFLQFFSASEDDCWGIHSEPWFDKIEYEYQNLRSAYYIFIENKLFENAWHLFYLLVPYWSVRTGYGEADSWMIVAKIDPSIELDDPDIVAINTNIKGKTYLWAAYVKTYLIQIETGYKFLHLAEQLLKEVEDDDNYCIALAMDGGYGIYMGYEDAPAKIKEAELLAEKVDSVMAKCITWIWPAEFYRSTGQLDFMNEKLDKGYKYLMENQIITQLPILIIQRSSYLFVDKKFKELADEAMETFKNLPEKGYRGFKGAFLAAYADAQLGLGLLEEAEKYYFLALDYIRGCGEKEPVFYSLLTAINLFMLKNCPQVAFTVMGAVDNFIKATNYPIFGNGELYYANAQSALSNYTNETDIAKWKEEGEKMTIEQALVYVAGS